MGDNVDDSNAHLNPGEAYLVRLDGIKCAENGANSADFAELDGRELVLIPQVDCDKLVVYRGEIEGTSEVGIISAEMRIINPGQAVLRFPELGVEYEATNIVNWRALTFMGWGGGYLCRMPTKMVAVASKAVGFHQTKMVPGPWHIPLRTTVTYVPADLRRIDSISRTTVVYDSSRLVSRIDPRV